MAPRLVRLLLRLSNEGARRRRSLIARLSGVRLGPECSIGPDCEVILGTGPRSGQISLGARTRLERGVVLHPYGGHIETGIDVFLGPYSAVYGHGGVTIGKDTLVSMHCRILSSNHAIPPPGTIIRSLADTLRPTRIGCDVWLGAGSTVLGGVAIGDGCVIGAGAVVTKEIPAGAIAVGVPASVRGWRS
jgi:acetyltransferase-like isoleucine patch superfamily enzyme